MIFFKSIVPKKYRPLIREMFFPLFYRGNKVFCSCCNEGFRRFLPFGVKQRENALCPKCGSLERHRLLWLFLKNKTNLFYDKLRVLHFAPEYIFQKKFKSMKNLDYISADLNSHLAMVKVDITNIPYENNYFDVILCIHVLEHILDDKKAIEELFRVLKRGGWAIIQPSVDLNRDKTFEDPNIISPQDRERVFGQNDHVRICGRDYKNRLENAGFKVRGDSYARDLDRDIIAKYGLKENGVIYFCSK